MIARLTRALKQDIALRFSLHSLPRRFNVCQALRVSCVVWDYARAASWLDRSWPISVASFGELPDKCS